MIEVTREIFEKSVTSECFKYTGIDAWEGVANDTDVITLVSKEYDIADVPPWAKEIVKKNIKYPGALWCPHYTFPFPVLEVVRAIGEKAALPFVHGCYCVGEERKERMLDYIFCLDAWDAGASCDVAADEMRARGSAKVKSWEEVCSAIWETLGERSELKELLVKRIIHRQRWWLKSTVWHDDRRDRYCRDQYLGDVACRGDSYGNPEFCDPYMAENESPRLRDLEERLSSVCPEWRSSWGAIDGSWLCGPKAFRFLERMIWFVGSGTPYSKEGHVIPSFLQCEDTFTSTEDMRGVFLELVDALKRLGDIETPRNAMEEELRKLVPSVTPVETWLASLLARKLELMPYF